MPASPLTLLVYSSVRWDLEFQRPQQLMSRLARLHRVIFIEEPLAASGEPRVERVSGGDGVIVLRPYGRAGGFDDARTVAAISPLLRRAVEKLSRGDLVTWLCTPAALPLAETVAARLLVYDCITQDPAESELESLVLDAADLVLTAGPGLWRAKRALHPNVHCVPSSTDAAQFAPERVTARLHEYLAAEQLQGHILAPRLGFMGVVDDTVDLALLDAVALRRPDWHLVIVGPVSTTRALPDRPNLHWLGDQPGTRLPALVAAWDVCLLPYVEDEGTRFLCPAQALEYLAAEKPVVATSLRDVSTMFGAAVHTARGARRFIEACDAALRETPEQRAVRLDLSSRCVSQYSWEEATKTVLRLLDVALEPHEDWSLIAGRPSARLSHDSTTAA